MTIDVTSYIWRKVMSICPLCKKPIYGRDLELHSLENADHWPMPVTIKHCSNTECVKLWMDANYAVRSTEVCIDQPSLTPEHTYE
ncbi:MAG TPA: hypothetical protein VKK79_02725 [Candidatus Lokiarchaeia archaeon]|nr:hypothetical protein [Candidatus Lokiarchaeia archaeon]